MLAIFMVMSVSFVRPASAVSTQSTYQIDLRGTAFGIHSIGLIPGKGDNSLFISIDTLDGNSKYIAAGKVWLALYSDDRATRSNSYVVTPNIVCVKLTYIGDADGNYTLIFEIGGIDPWTNSTELQRQFIVGPSGNAQIVSPSQPLNLPAVLAPLMIVITIIPTFARINQKRGKRPVG